MSLETVKINGSRDAASCKKIKRCARARDSIPTSPVTICPGVHQPDFSACQSVAVVLKFYAISHARTKKE